MRWSSEDEVIGCRAAWDGSRAQREGPLCWRSTFSGLARKADDKSTARQKQTSPSAGLSVRYGAGSGMAGFGCRFADSCRSAANPFGDVPGLVDGSPKAAVPGAPLLSARCGLMIKGCLLLDRTGQRPRSKCARHSPIYECEEVASPRPALAGFAASNSQDPRAAFPGRRSGALWR